MEKVVFTLPDSITNHKSNETNEIAFNKNVVVCSNVNDTLSSNTQMNQMQMRQSKNNNIEPTKVLENVYTFEDDSNIHMTDNTSVTSLYSKGLLLKKQKKIKEAISVFLECLKNEDKSDEKLVDIYYEVYVNLGLLTPQVDENFEIIKGYYTSAFTLCPDRAEPYYYFSIYCSLLKRYDVTYDVLKKIVNISYDEAKNKYKSVQHDAYGKHLYFDLGIACCEITKYDEGLELLNSIKTDPDFHFMEETIKQKIHLYETKKKQKVTVNSEYPSLCFISMCKNEEHVIKQTLESVYKYIDYWVICDTGSTDNTCKIIQDFFAEKNIPGELYIDEWKGFDVNKSLMFERAYNLTDYVLHLDADDWLCGNFDKNMLKKQDSDAFFFTYKRGNSEWLATSLYNNRLKWKYVGVAHNIIICLDNKNVKYSSCFVTDNVWVDGNERGFRSFDPQKYLKDAEKLEKQFFDSLYEDPYGLVNRSIFYTGQSYFDYKDYVSAFKWYNLYTKLKNTWVEEVFESHLRLMQCRIALHHNETQIKEQFELAVNIFNDRSEPYMIIGNYYFHKGDHPVAYDYFIKAKSFNYDMVKNKYSLFVNKYSYGKYINDNLAVCCSYINKKYEGRKLIDEIINDSEFEAHRERLLKNLEFM